VASTLIRPIGTGSETSSASISNPQSRIGHAVWLEVALFFPRSQKDEIMPCWAEAYPGLGGARTAVHD
jgi:hypothetical protein